MENTLFRNRYRIPSARLSGWGYDTAGWYFITIKTRNNYPFFGRIENGTMKLSEIGCAAKDCWECIPGHFPDVQLDSFIIMPDHIHGIIIIHPVETQNLASLPFLTPACRVARTGNKFGPQSRNVPSIVRGFKIGVSKWAHKHGCMDFSWQSRFHDRIIRDNDELDGVREYICNNAVKHWIEFGND